MDFSGFIGGILSIARGNTIIAIVIALGFLFFMYRRPKLFFGILFFVLLMAVLFYMISTMAGSGSDQKRRLIGQEEKQFDSQ